jgi:hypothetical protein
MVDKAEVFERKELRSRSRIDIEIREWENASSLPVFDLDLDIRGPEEVRLLWRRSSLFLNWHVHVRAAAVVFGAITTVKID